MPSLTIPVLSLSPLPRLSPSALQNFACKAPTTSPAKVAELLREPRSVGAPKPQPVALPRLSKPS